MRNKGVVALGLALAGTLALSGCAAGSSGEEADGVTIEWWHIQTQEPTRGVWQELADEFEASHEGVKIDITVQNDPEFKTCCARLQNQVRFTPEPIPEPIPAILHRGGSCNQRRLFCATRELWRWV